MVRREDPNGEDADWCRNCSEYGWCRLVPTLMNRCRPTRKDRHKRALRESRGRSARDWGNNLKTEASWRKRLWNVAESRMLEDSQGLSKNGEEMFLAVVEGG